MSDTEFFFFDYLSELTCQNFFWGCYEAANLMLVHRKANAVTVQ